MSNHAHNDKADQFRLSQIKQEYEKVIDELKRENSVLAKESTEKNDEIKNLKTVNKDQ